MIYLLFVVWPPRFSSQLNNYIPTCNEHIAPRQAAVVLLTACRHCRCSCMEAEPVLLRRLLATASSPARKPLPTTAPPDAPAAQPGAAVPPFGLPDLTPQATMVWLQQPALPPCADMGMQEIHGVRDYALVFSVVTVFTACSFTVVTPNFI